MTVASRSCKHMKNNIKITLLKQATTSVEDINHIINLKIQHWLHPFESQKEWIIKNIEPDDFNLMLKINSKLVGFMNLVYVNALIDDKTNLKLLGVGNVCVSKEFSGKGLGLLLMQIANYQIQALGFNGVLLCSDKLVPFYLKAGWIKTQSEVSIRETRFEGNTMFLEGITSQSIVLNRSF